jgi:ribosomal-protein-alanine N-acetyltransferase
MTKNAELPKIETARLILRAYLPEDTDALLAIWRDPDLSQYFPPSFKERDQQEMLECIRRTANLWQTRGYSQWGVVSKNDGQLIGYCGLQVLDNTCEVELYYGFTRNFWGQGIATEATRAAVRYGFEEIKL